MRRAWKWLLRLVVLGLVLVGGLVAHTVWFKPLRIDWFYTRTFAEYALQSPELLSTLRILPRWLDFYSDKLDDASPAHELKLAAMVKDAHAMLHRYHRSVLSPQEQLSYDVLNYFLAIQLEGDDFRFYNFPVNQMGGVQSSLPNFMIQIHRVTNSGEAESYLKRLDKFPIKFAQVIEGLEVREAKRILPPQFL